MLSIIMIISAVAGFETSVFAEELSGSCGTGVVWSLNTETGKLIISGNGTMTNFGFMTTAPWKSYAAIITEVEVCDGVESLGQSAFDGCSNLTKVTIADSVERIENYAFKNCTALNDITLPNNSNLYISSDLFTATAYYNDASNWEDDVLYIGDNLIVARQTIEGTYSIKEGTKSIATYAFRDCTGLTGVTVPNSITKLYYGVFNGCSALVNISLPDTIDYIGQYAFDGTGIFNTQKANYNRVQIGNYFIWAKPVSEMETYVITAGTKLIAECAFQYRGYTSAIKAVKIPKSVKYIGFNAFDACTGLTDVYYDGTEAQWNDINIVTYDELYYPPESNVPLTEATKHFKTVYTGNFSSDLTWELDAEGGLLRIFGTGKIPSYFMASFIPWYNYIGQITEVVIEDGVTGIGGSTFKGYPNLEKVTIADTVTEIGGSAFKDCPQLSDITIGSGVITLGSDIFTGTAYYNDEDNWTNGNLLYMYNYFFAAKTSLSGDFAVAEGTKAVAAGAFSDCTELTSVTIPDGVKTIATGTFRNCSKLAQVQIPSSVNNIEVDAFTNALIYNSQLAEKQFVSISDCLIYVTPSYAGTDYTVPEGTRLIAESVFGYRSCPIVRITLPKSLKVICVNSFDICYSLTDIYYDGTESAWNALDIASYAEKYESETNAPLFAANVHCAPDEGTKVIGDVTGATFDYELQGVDDENVVLIAAEYDGNKLLNASEISDIAENLSGSTGITVTAGHTYKLFLWNSLKGMTPICGSWSN